MLLPSWGRVVSSGMFYDSALGLQIYFSFAMWFSIMRLNQEHCGSDSPAFAQSSCSVESTNAGNFNGTAISGTSYIWFNANFTASGIPSTGATLTFTNSTISFTAGGTPYRPTAWRPDRIVVGDVLLHGESAVRSRQ